MAIMFIQSPADILASFRHRM